MDSLQRGSLFAVFTPQGDLDGTSSSGSGLYFWDTRVLFILRVRLRHHPIVIVSRRPEEGKLVYEGVASPDGGLFLRKELALGARELRVSLLVENRAGRPLSDELEVELGASFEDVFEVRGIEPLRRVITQERLEGGLLFRYEGQDGIRREVRLRFSPGLRIQGDERGCCLVLPMALEPGERLPLLLEATVEFEPRRPVKTLELLQEEQDPEPLPWRLPPVREPRLAQLIEQARRDLESLMWHFKPGPIASAGRPWFVALFGRDSLITALEILPFLPELARGTLAILGRLQATQDDPTRDAEAGKIPHELRVGELANLGRVPFDPYYGSVDTTPLFVFLLGQYLKESGDWAFLKLMEQKLALALGWIERTLREGEGFIYYQRRAEGGLENQGWKDSRDAICFQDGRPICGRPVALVEVQGYAYAALVEGARLKRRLGDEREAERLEREATRLKRRFNQAFWLKEEGYFALALARGPQGPEPVDAITSNPGHGLLTGIIAEEKIASVVQRLLSPELFSGYGVRTMSTSCLAYDPKSYHNGSIWPHDNALILLGLLKWGFRREARRIAEGLLEAASAFHGQLPELFAGFPRQAGRGPIPYEGACRPQAWAAGGGFVLARVLLTEWG